jgi:hypothetical protein
VAQVVLVDSLVAAVAAVVPLRSPPAPATVPFKAQALMAATAQSS